MSCRTSSHGMSLCIIYGPESAKKDGFSSVCEESCAAGPVGALFCSVFACSSLSEVLLFELELLFSSAHFKT